MRSRIGIQEEKTNTNIAAFLQKAESSRRSRRALRRIIGIACALAIGGAALAQHTHGHPANIAEVQAQQPAMADGTMKYAGVDKDVDAIATIGTFVQLCHPELYNTRTFKIAIYRTATLTGAINHSEAEFMMAGVEVQDLINKAGGEEAFCRLYEPEMGKTVKMMME